MDIVSKVYTKMELLQLANEDPKTSSRVYVKILFIGRSIHENALSFSRHERKSISQGVKIHSLFKLCIGELQSGLCQCRRYPLARVGRSA